ncbi:MAG: SEC-C metal-binding domain-containing protein [Bryobacteraceae bacterium]
MHNRAQRSTIPARSRAGKCLPDAQFCTKAGNLRRPQPKIARNHPCPCGSGKKYKRCRLGIASAAAA